MSITLSVPADRLYLEAAAAMFSDLARKLEARGAVIPEEKTVIAEEVAYIAPAMPQIPTPPVVGLAAALPQAPVQPVVEQPAAPAATVPPIVIPPGVPKDSEGLPWDSRIHVTKRTKRLSDDTWKLQPGIDKAFVEQVKNELRCAMAAQPQIPQVPTPPVTVIPAPPAQPQVPTPPVTINVTPAGEDAFPAFVDWCTAQINAGRLAHQQIVDVCTSNGIAQLPLLANRPDLIPFIQASLEAACRMPA